MKILLVNPGTDRSISSELPGGVAREVGRFPPLGLLTMAAFLLEGGKHEVEVIDMPARGVSVSGLAESIAARRPGIVGITAITNNLVEVADTVRAVKKVSPDIRVCLGGPHIDAFPEEAIGLSGVDYTVRGDGERPLSLLLDALSAGEAKPRDVPGLSWKIDGNVAVADKAWFEPDPGSLPLPARRLVERDDYYYILGGKSTFATVSASRGCPFKCAFCSTPGGGYRAVPPGRVAEELADCVALGAGEVHFVDDAFNLTARRLAEVSREVLRRSVRAKWSIRCRVDALDEESAALAASAGCVRIHLGVETGSDEGMKRLGKGVTVAGVNAAVGLLRRHGIVSAAYFILGCPFEKTVADVRRTVEFAVRLDPDFAMFNALALYPGAPLFEDAARLGLVDPGCWRAFAANPDPEFVAPFWEEHLHRETISGELNRAYRRFYFRPAPVLRELRRLRTPADLARKAGAALALLRGGS